MRARRLLPILLVIGLAMGGALSFAGGAARAQTDGTVTVTLGAAISESGRFAAISREVIDGYALVVETVNEAGGIALADGRRARFALAFRDDESDTAGATAATRALIEEDGVDFLLGPYSSGLSESVAAVAEAADMPVVISNGTASFLFDQGRRNLFAVPSTSRQYLAGTVDLIGKELLAVGRDPAEARIALAFLGNAGTQEIRDGVLDELMRWGMTIAVDEVLAEDFSNLPAILKAAEAARADALLFSGFSAGSTAAVDALHAAGIYLPLVAMTHCDPAALADRPPAARDYLICGTQWDRYLSYRDRWFGTANEYAFFYEEKTGRPVTYQAAQSSAAVLVLADAIERAGTLERDAVRAALAETNLETLFGEIRFDETGRNVAKPMLFYQIRDGRFQIVAPANWAWDTVVYPAPPRSMR
ncbi:ABC transporter substrate-binding protein [Marivibrio halodurans]|uniref:ABC transporter substrate-binding protein n=1 Tax=Marivibrio halodurans TaxID=2039722 RepID=A0A8J7S2W5_9PROT|nr:ABC transporter substrate-binding protein [Marivibrio halodurans]MBP5858850.1 ABC transporter substrate-binding protein [Marivibrio halodurans]